MPRAAIAVRLPDEALALGRLDEALALGLQRLAFALSFGRQALVRLHLPREPLALVPCHSSRSRSASHSRRSCSSSPSLSDPSSGTRQLVVAIRSPFSTSSLRCMKVPLSLIVPVPLRNTRWYFR